MRTVSLEVRRKTSRRDKSKEKEKKMTIGGWIIFGIIAAIIVGPTIVLAMSCDSKGGAVAISIGSAVLVLIILAGMLFYYNNTASGKRAFKTQESDLNNGLYRGIYVYSMNGELIEEYHGKFDVDYDESRLVFDDEEGLRHVVYYTTGTVVINEERKESNDKEN